MGRFWGWLVVAFACIACGGGATAKSANDDSVALDVAMQTVQLTLPNGLVVVLHPEPTAPSVYVHVRYHVGSKDDPEGRPGFAHFFEHLMFRGGKHTGERGFGSWVEAAGGTYNGTTGADTTDYYEEAPPAQLPLLLWLEGDRMAYPAADIPDDGFATERDVVKNEHRERRENVAYGNVHRIARNAVFGPSHPYGREGELGDDLLDKSTPADARAFGAKFYRPNNATLVICGAFDPRLAQGLVEKYFATIPPGPPIPRLVIPPPALAAERKIAIAANVDAPMVAFAWPAPPVESDGYQELSMGLNVLDSALTWRLVHEKKLADSVEAYLDPGRLGSLVVIEIRLAKNANTNDVISDADLYLRKMSELGRVGRWTSFPDFKTRALVSQVVHLESLAPRANRILHGLEYHQRPDSVQIDLKRIQAVEAPDVGTAIEHFLKDAPRVVLLVEPDRSAPRAGRTR